MEADRGQAGIASVLSVGLHTSPCTGPGPDPFTQTHSDIYLSDSGVGDTVAVALQLCGALTFGVFHK